jgi:hypothetical protein
MTINNERENIMEQLRHIEVNRMWNKIFNILKSKIDNFIEI